LTEKLGFKAPRNSTNLVFPERMNVEATDDERNISFRPTPNYAALAEAATGGSISKSAGSDVDVWMKGIQVISVESLRRELEGASDRIQRAGKGMLIEEQMS
jgi:hypothetical protein